MADVMMILIIRSSEPTPFTVICLKRVALKKMILFAINILYITRDLILE